MDQQLISLVLLVAVFYFLLIRPQQVRNRKHKELLAALAVGDHVVTLGGMNGTVVGFGEETVILRVAEHVEVEFNKGAIAAIKPPAEEHVAPAEDEPAEEVPLSDD